MQTDRSMNTSQINFDSQIPVHFTQQHVAPASQIGLPTTFPSVDSAMGVRNDYLLYANDTHHQPHLQFPVNQSTAAPAPGMPFITHYTYPPMYIPITATNQMDAGASFNQMNPASNTAQRSEFKSDSIRSESRASEPVCLLPTYGISI